MNIEIEEIPYEGISHGEIIRANIRTLFLNNPFVGTIEERLLDEHLYCLTKEDMTLSREQRIALRLPGERPPVAQTGKVGVIAFVKAGNEQGASEEEIAKNIWIEMVVDGILLFVNIKDVRIEKGETQIE